MLFPSCKQCRHLMDVARSPVFSTAERETIPNLLALSCIANARKTHSPS